LAKQTGYFMKTDEINKVLEEVFGKGNFVLISSGGPSKMKPIRIVGKLVPINPKPRVQIVDFIDERR